MDDVTRRDALRLVAGAGAGAVVGAAPGVAAAQEEKKKGRRRPRGEGKQKIPDELGKMVKQLAREMQDKLSAAAKEGRFKLNDQQIRTVNVDLEARITSPQLAPQGVIIIITGSGSDPQIADKDPDDTVISDRD